MAPKSKATEIIELSPESVTRAEWIRGVYAKTGRPECTLTDAVEVALVAYVQSISAAMTEPVASQD